MDEVRLLRTAGAPRLAISATGSSQLDLVCFELVHRRAARHGLASLPLPLRVSVPVSVFVSVSVSEVRSQKPDRDAWRQSG